MALAMETSVLPVKMCLIGCIVYQLTENRVQLTVVVVFLVPAFFFGMLCHVFVAPSLRHIKIIASYP